MSKFAVAAFVVVLGLCASAAAGEAEDKRVRLLVSKLSQPVAEIDKGDLPLPFLLETLEGSVNGTEKEPSKMMKIVVDVDGFNQALKDGFDPEKKSIRIPAKLVGVRLDTILGTICEQLDAVALVRSEFIAIVPLSTAIPELNIQFANGQRIPSLVHQFLTKVPLEKAFQQIAEQNNANIVLAPGLEAKSEIPVTARLLNVPIDAAVEILADMAGLKVVRRANVFLVTTKEHAIEIEAERKKAKNANEPDTSKLEAPLKEKN